MLEPVLDFLFPLRCAGCRQRGSWFCERCAGSVRRPRLGACRRCRRMVSVDPCPMCEAGEGPDSMIAMARLEGPLRSAIHRLKYGDRPQLAGPIVAATLVPGRVGPGPICPVPLHPTRRLRRGYNQAELLAREVAKAAGAPVLAGLRRTSGGAQVGRGGAARRAALEGAFRWDGRFEVPREVVVLDDVLTTGSTLLDCSRALREAGVERVDALAIALG